MRTINVELNFAKLAQKKVQLAQYENRIVNLKAELVEVTEKRDKKQAEIQALQTAIEVAQNTSAVS